MIEVQILLNVRPDKMDEVFKVADISKNLFIVVLDIIILKFNVDAILIFNVILL
jgi:hypothetical protein